MRTLLLAILFAPQQVENRAPKPDEVGYRPADGATVRLNPPSLSWLHERAAASYIVQWSAKEDFSGATTVRDVPWNTYTHSAPIAPGTWHWRYRFVTKDGAESGWSVARGFTVPADAVAFPLPTRAQQRERVPREHPRLFMRPEDLPRLREGAKGASFAKLRAEAEALLKAEPTPEPATMGDLKDPKTAEFWWPNRVQTLKACQEAETLAFVYLITGEKAFGEAARKWILHLASWNVDGPTNFGINCEAAKPILHRVPRAYDWAYGALTVEDREKVRSVWLRRAQDAWKSREVGQAVGHLNAPYGNHAQRTFHKLGECGIAFLGEIPEAATWLDYSLNTFYAVYPVWNDDDGGWHQGVSYWGGYMVKIVWWLQVMRSALDIDGFKKPFFAQVGDFPLYIAPPGSPNEGFGDLSHQTPPKSWGGFMDYFLRAQAGRGYWRWWTERWGMTGETGILGFLYENNLGPLPESKPPTDLPPSKVFRGVGIASLHTTLLDSAEDVHLLFKSSPFGGQSHGHNPQNSFQLNAYGEALLTTCVYRDLHGSKFHTGWCHSTVAHNAVLVDGQGQLKNSPVPSGRIAEVRLTPGWDYVAGDAADAYPGRLTRYRRHVLFVKPDLIVIYDDLAAPAPSTFQFMLHALRPFEVDEKAVAVRVEKASAGVEARYLSPVPLAFRQWDGYEPKPPREFPNQWHVEAGTAEKLKDCGMLTVIVPHRAGRRMAWTAARIESATAVGVRFERDGKTTRVLFRKAGVAGEASADGVAFSDPAAVR